MALSLVGSGAGTVSDAGGTTTVSLVCSSGNFRTGDIIAVGGLQIGSGTLVLTDTFRFGNADILHMGIDIIAFDASMSGSPTYNLVLTGYTGVLIPTALVFRSSVVSSLGSPTGAFTSHRPSSLTVAGTDAAFGDNLIGTSTPVTRALGASSPLAADFSGAHPEGLTIACLATHWRSGTATGTTWTNYSSSMTACGPYEANPLGGFDQISAQLYYYINANGGDVSEPTITQDIEWHGASERRDSALVRAQFVVAYDGIVPVLDEEDTGPQYERRHVTARALPYYLDTGLLRRFDGRG